MSKQNDGGRLAALAGMSMAAIAALMLQLPVGAAAGVSTTGGVIAAAGSAAATGAGSSASTGSGVIPAAAATAPGSIAVPDDAPPSAAPAPRPRGQYQLRCWQYGKLLFDEGPVTLGADVRLGAKLVATDRNGAAVLVTDAGGATTCLARPAAAPPSLALPR